MLIKGYKYDAGIDVILQEKVVLKAKEMSVIDLGIQFTPAVGECAMLCARTSAAKKGIYVAMCPIDTDYIGNVHAIVYNLSNCDVEYDKGQAFCQIVPLVLAKSGFNIKTKKLGRRLTSNFGGTDEPNRDKNT